ncbi:hypothetical protein D3C71_1317730 [compost metagenome]
MGTVRRHKHILHFQAFAAGAGQAENVPVVDDLVVGARHQQRNTVDGDAVFVTYQATDEGPLAMVRAARAFPLAAELVAALDLVATAGRSIGRRDNDGVVLAPDVFGGARVHVAEFPLVHAQDHHVPCAAGAAAAQLHQHAPKHAGIEFPAAPALFLQDFEEAGIDKGFDGLR